jgi:cytochrome c biogenesis protein CcmG/thiol:disulfide interchange protein DsbE
MKRLFLVVLLVLLPVALLAFGLRGNPRVVPSPLVGKPAPDFTLQLFDGGQIALTELRGQVVVVNFWASWCIPCREEAPALEATWQRQRARGVVFVGVNIQDREPDARAFIREHGKTYPNGPDLRGVISIAYGVYGVPETFILDREGRIQHKHIGAVTAEVLEREIERALSGKEGRA